MGPESLRVDDAEDSDSEGGMLLEVSDHYQYPFASLHHRHSLFYVTFPTCSPWFPCQKFSDDQSTPAPSVNKLHMVTPAGPLHVLLALLRSLVGKRKMLKGSWLPFMAVLLFRVSVVKKPADTHTT